MSGSLITGLSVDSFHEWENSNPDWTETFWFGAWVPEAKVSIYIYHWFRPVLGIYGGGCLIWDDRHWLPWDLPVYHYDVNNPIRGANDLRNLDLHRPEQDTRTRLRSLVEGKVYEIDYHHGATQLQLRFESELPPEVTDNRGTEEFFAGHLDQAGHYTGTLAYEGGTHRIDCYGIRDRSWGPRVISNDIRLGYCHGQSPELAFLAYSKPDGERIFKGYLQRNGRREALQAGTREVHFSDGVLQSIDLELITAAGEVVRGRGLPLNRFAYLPYPNLLTWLYLMRWEIAGSVVYGEEQDAWSLPLWRQHLLAGAWA